MIRYAALAMLLTPVAAMAAPVALQCTLDDRGKPVAMNLQLNEEAGTASWYWPGNGMSSKQSAIFTPVNVSFGHFQLDRSTMVIVRENDAIMVSQLNMPTTTSGKCAIDTAKRAF